MQDGRHARPDRAGAPVRSQEELRSKPFETADVRRLFPDTYLHGQALVDGLVLANICLYLCFDFDRAAALLTRMATVEAGTIVVAPTAGQSVSDRELAEATYARRNYARYRECVTARDWINAVLVVSNGARLPVIEALQRQRLITFTELNALLADLYTNAGYAADFDQQRVVRLFELADFVTDTDGLRPPRKTLTAWRGAAARRGKGLSWTTDRSVAQQFADRHAQMRGMGYVYETQVPPRAVLAQFNGRREAEVVVDPRRLPQPRIVERIRSSASDAA